MLLVCAHVRDWKIYQDKLSECAPAETETCKVIFKRRVGRGRLRRVTVRAQISVSEVLSIFHTHALNFTAYRTGVTKHHNFHLKAPKH